jgi:ubiquinone/menaquinone biosynthesis C-methylase UbiE
MNYYPESGKGRFNMGLYSKYVLPHLIDLSMKDRATTNCRSEIIPKAAGRVLEVGVGSGLNFPYYGPSVTYMWGIDPSHELLAMAGPKVSAAPCPVELICESAEKISLDSASVDTIVLAWSLCSIPNPSRALEEMRRVLKPGGAVVFAEHGLAPDPGVRRWQERINPIWRRVAGGCNMNRKIDELIADAGFDIKELRKSYFPGPRILTYTYEGIAV